MCWCLCVWVLWYRRQHSNINYIYVCIHRHLLTTQDCRNRQRPKLREGAVAVLSSSPRSTAIEYAANVRKKQHTPISFVWPGRFSCHAQLNRSMAFWAQSRWNITYVKLLECHQNGRGKSSRTESESRPRFQQHPIKKITNQTKCKTTTESLVSKTHSFQALLTNDDLCVRVCVFLFYHLSLLSNADWKWATLFSVKLSKRPIYIELKCVMPSPHKRKDDTKRAECLAAVISSARFIWLWRVWLSTTDGIYTHLFHSKPLMNGLLLVIFLFCSVFFCFLSSSEIGHMGSSNG